MMDLLSTIKKEHSKKNCEKIVNWIGNNQSRYDELVRIFLTEDARTVQCASWPLSESVKRNPALAGKHLGTLLKNLKKKGLHSAIRRNTMRLMESCELPEKYHGEIMTLCFDFVMSPAEDVAVKCYSMGVLRKLIKIYPEIKQELKTIVEERWDEETAAFRSRAKKVLSL